MIEGNVGGSFDVVFWFFEVVWLRGCSKFGFCEAWGVRS